MNIRNIILILMLCSLAFSIQMLEPVTKEIKSGDEIFLGTIGPGQTLHVEFNPWIYDSNEKYVAHYDMAQTAYLPEMWKSTKSKLYGDPLQITITADEFEKEGTYEIGIKILDEDHAEGVTDVIFTGLVKIDYDVIDMNVFPKKITTGTNQPAKYYITIENKGSGGDVFEVASENIPQWSFKKHVFVPAMESKTIVYEIVESEEESYSPIITITSTSSSIIKKEEKLVLEVRSDLWNDFKAVNHGTPIFPILEEPIFALMGLLSNLW